MAPAFAQTMFWRILGLWLAALLGAFLLAAPARAQDVATIAQARSALEAARSERAVRALAAVELDAAEQALERALAALEARRPQSEIGHLAYLADRRAAIAQMRAKAILSARMLSSLTATRAMVLHARGLETAAAHRRVRVLAQQLRRFDVKADQRRVLLTPRERWFEAGLMPGPHAIRAIAEAAGMLGRLADRDVVVVGYDLDGARRRALVEDALAPATPADAAGSAVSPRSHGASLGADGRGPGGPDAEGLGCARADVVRAFLISRGVDPRRVAITCVTPDGTPEPSAGASPPLAGQTAIAIPLEQGFAWATPAGPAPAPTIDRAADAVIDAGSGAR